MKKENQLVLLFVILVVGSLSYCHFRKGPAGKISEEEIVDEGPHAPVSQTPMPAPVPPPSQPSTEAGFLPTQMEDPAVFEALDKNLQEMGKCLNMKMGPLDPQSEFNLDTLLRTIGPDLGDVVIRADEWFATDIRTPQGEVRRIHLELASAMDPQAPRVLNYYTMSGGSQKIIPLPAEQTVNPTDTLLASLESDGTVVSRSKSQRTYFENGDNLLTVEKDGKVYSFQLPHDGKTFMCTGADSAKTMRCVCR